MAKKKKTRQDKIKADLRHELPQSPLYVVSNPTEVIENIKIHSAQRVTHSNLYFANDLRRTFYLIAVILATQLGLFFMLQNHIIKLPFITY